MEAGGGTESRKIIQFQHEERITCSIF